ncbi:hypothetical protein QR685DRAFT_508489 [Neurospora intermedia]|uniref:Questionable protein n=1 Tax=Neurospora intermedia TaxID=5142 RepID=A0ABR3D0U9_NEUIN
MSNVPKKWKNITRRRGDQHLSMIINESPTSYRSFAVSLGLFGLLTPALNTNTQLHLTSLVNTTVKMCIVKEVRLARDETKVSVAGWMHPIERRRFKDCGKEDCYDSTHCTDKRAKDLKEVKWWTPADGYDYVGGEEDRQRHEREQEEKEREQEKDGEVSRAA